jgi:hypothetical protein
MRRTIGRVATLAVLVLTWPAAGTAQAPDTPDARREAVLRHIAAVPVDGVIDDMINTLARQIPEDRRQEFIGLMRKLVPLDGVRAVTREAMIKHFTVAEIDAMTNFYGSPEGKAITKKFGTYMGEVIPQIQVELLRALEKVKEEMRI